MSARAKIDKTPQWPVDMAQVIQRAGLRKRGANRNVGLMALAVAADELGWPVHLSSRTLRFNRGDATEERDAMVLYQGDDFLSLELDSDWNAVAERLLKRNGSAKMSQTEYEQAYWTTGAQGVNVPMAVTTQQWFQAEVDRIRTELERAVAMRCEQQLEQRTDIAVATSVRRGPRL